MACPLLLWEIAGFFFIAIAGSLLHFLFAWSGKKAALAWLAPVNESVWEHFKLGFWPGLCWALIEYAACGGQVANYWPAKFLGLLAMPVLIALLFYGYTAIAGRNYLAADIAVFILAVACGQAISYRAMYAPVLGAAAYAAAVAGLLALAAAFALFSYCPPRLPVFLDPVGGGYGM